MHRDEQLCLLPGVPGRYVGRDVPSVVRGTNADLVATVAPLYLGGDVVDVTYGLGAWWRRYRPASFVAHDLDPTRGDGVDFTALPEPDESYDTVVFDPPYVPTGGLATSTLAATYRDAYGLIQRSNGELRELIAAGLAECRRVLRPTGWLLVKCGDYTNSSGPLVLGHRYVLDVADTLELECWDLIVHHTGSGPLGVNVARWRRARRHHSYLLVFRRRRVTRSRVTRQVG
jgi:hypothetical protein